MIDALYYEDWDAAYGSPYLIDETEAAEGSGQLAERLSTGGFGLNPARGDHPRVAFVDGVRRGEGLLYKRSPGGVLVRGVAGLLLHRFWETSLFGSGAFPYGRSSSWLVPRC